MCEYKIEMCVMNGGCELYGLSVTGFPFISHPAVYGEPIK